MWEAVERIAIEAPPESVWAIVSDIEGHPNLAGSGEVRSIRMDGPLAVGTTFEGDVVVGTYGSFVARCAVTALEPGRELAWVSYPPLDEGETEDHQIEVHWSFLLAPVGDATEVEHRFHVPEPKMGTEELAAFLERTDRITTVRAGMRATLENLKRRAESG